MGDSDFEASPAARRSRQFGTDRGRIMVSDDFDAPLPNELLDAFEGEPLATPPFDPLRELEHWLADARRARLPHPAAASFVTVGVGGQPSVRTVSLKRVEMTTLLLTSALWTRKVDELRANPQVALLLHWPSLGRQVQVSATAEIVDDPALADELFAERGELHQWQAVVSRQGEPIDGLGPMREQLGKLRGAHPGTPARPADWGVLRLRPTVVEFWAEAADRLHERRVSTLGDDGRWTVGLIAP